MAYGAFMADTKLQLKICGLIPAPGGVGVFLEAEGKVITIRVDHMVGQALQLAVEGTVPPRPLTHNLLASVLGGLGVKVVQVVIHDCREGTYYARLHLEQENELGKSDLEVDSRPSDAMVLALQHDARICMDRKIWEAAEDMKWALDQMEGGASGEWKPGA